MDLGTGDDASRALILDVDGVVSPVYGRTAWGDDVVAGQLFGPVFVSPKMCARLEVIANRPDLSPWWLTMWTGDMRAAVDPFPGRRWPSIPTQPYHVAGRTWWKRVALEAWLAGHPQVRTLVWCDDHLRASARSRAIRRWLEDRGLDALLIAPDIAVGLTPEHLDRIDDRLSP